MPVINEENREKKLNFDEKGKFCKGNTISKGKRKRTQIGKLTATLKKEEGYLGRQGIDIIRQVVSVRLI
ncbi:hypothetical protein ES708_19812 [subsurface metagenome]|jgi:hypothetical protein